MNVDTFGHTFKHLGHIINHAGAHTLTLDKTFVRGCISIPMGSLMRIYSLTASAALTRVNNHKNLTTHLGGVEK